MRAWKIVRSSAAGALVLLLFGGATCQASYCSEDCDPCVEKCACRRHCSQGLAADFEAAHRLERFVLRVDRGDDGAWSRHHTSIVGLSIDRALGVHAHDARAIELFARNVIVANEDRFGAEHAWTLAAIDRAGDGVVVTFAHARDGSAALAFLLDRAGNLLEVVDHGSARRAEG